MDAPPIQYARTEDGVNIAYWARGDGPTVLFLNGPHFSHSQLLWAIPEAADFFELFGRGRRLVGFDWRGTGLSDREPIDFSPGAMQRDVAAVVEQLALERYSLLAQDQSSYVAIPFAASRLEEVLAMALWHGSLGIDNRAKAVEMGSELMRQNFALWTETVLPMMAGEGASDAFLAGVKALLLGAMNQEAVTAWQDAIFEHDVTDAAHQVTQPTLVVHRRECRSHQLALAQRLAAAIGPAQLQILPGHGTPPWDGRVDESLRVLVEFFDSVEPATADGAASPRSTSTIGTTTTATGFRALLFTDLESSTALTQAVGDEKAQEIPRGHNDAVRAALEAHGGEEVKHLGDGIMAAFGSAVGAVEASLQIQRELAGAEVRVRIGLNAGEPIQEDDDYFGSAVQLAARVCDRAEPGQVLVSQVVRDLCRGKTFNFEDQGEATLKGFPEPVRLFVVGKGD